MSVHPAAVTGISPYRLILFGFCLLPEHRWLRQELDMQNFKGISMANLREEVNSEEKRNDGSLR
jgi:hypothetical protein